MRRLTDAEMHDVYDVARLANDLVEGYDYLLSVVQAAEPHALADVAALREEARALREENARLKADRSRLFNDQAELRGANSELSRLHSRVAELEGDAATLARIQAQVDRTGWAGIAAGFDGIEDAVSQLIGFCREHSDPNGSPAVSPDQVAAGVENERLRARVAELEGAAANWALVEAMPKDSRLVRTKTGRFRVSYPEFRPHALCETPAAALRAAFGKGEGE